MDNNNNNQYIHHIQKMQFIFNALEKGWSVKKNRDNYIFTKKHEGKKEVVSDNFLSRFMKENLLSEKNIF
jgi:hypothetical protein